MKKLDTTNKNIIKNILGAFVVKGGSLLFSVLMFPAYIRFFGNSVILGIWYTLLSILNWVGLFDLGLGQGLRNQLPSAIEQNDRKRIKECISTTYILMLLLAAAIAILGVIAIPCLNWNSVFNVAADVVDNETLGMCVQIVFLGIMLQIVLKIIVSILYAMQQSAIVNLIALSTNVLIYISLIMLPSQDVKSNLITMSVVNVIAANVPYIICTIIVFLTSMKDVKPSIRAFNKRYIKDIFFVGLSLLWLQVIFMVVSSTNEFLITNFTGPEDVVEYQAYYKVFKTAAMVVSLALTPIWSAVTKAQAQKRYSWIVKVYKIFIIGTAACFVVQMCVIPILQWVMDIWLGKGTITVNALYAVAFVFSSTVFVLHNVNTSIGNGLSYFKIQMIWMTVAAVVFIPLSYIMVQITGSWIGVVIANVLAMVPYEIIAPIYTFKFLKKKAIDG